MGCVGRVGPFANSPTLRDAEPDVVPFLDAPLYLCHTNASALAPFILRTGTRYFGSALQNLVFRIQATIPQCHLLGHYLEQLIHILNRNGLDSVDALYKLYISVQQGNKNYRSTALDACYLRQNLPVEVIPVHLQSPGAKQHMKQNEILKRNPNNC